MRAARRPCARALHETRQLAARLHQHHAHRRLGAEFVDHQREILESPTGFRDIDNRSFWNENGRIGNDHDPEPPCSGTVTRDGRAPGAGLQEQFTPEMYSEAPPSRLPGEYSVRAAMAMVKV